MDLARQAFLSITNSQSRPKPMSIESVMPSNHLILCRPLLLLSSIFPSIRVFLNESALRIRWPKYWSFSFKISPSSEHPGLTQFCTGLRTAMTEERAKPWNTEETQTWAASRQGGGSLSWHLHRCHIRGSLDLCLQPSFCNPCPTML